MNIQLVLLRKLVSAISKTPFWQVYETDIEELRRRIKSILIIQLQYLGDSLIFTPILKAIRATHPNCRIDIIVNNISHEVYKNNPNVDRLYVLKGWRYIPGRVHFGIKDLLWMLRIGRKMHYDCVLMDITEAAFQYSLLAFATGIRNRIGFKFRRKNYLNTFEIDVGSLRNESFLKLNLRLATTMGAENIAFPSVELHYNKDDCEYVDRILSKSAQSKPLIGINPFAKQETNRWPYERFSKLIDLLGSTYDDSSIVIIGGRDHIQDLPLILGSTSTKVRNVAGKTTFAQMAYLIAKLDIFITLDSGPMHLCSQTKVPTVCLISGRNLEKQWTYDYPHYVYLMHKVNCSPCYSNVCPTGTHKCMELISVDQVFSKVQELLDHSTA